MRPSKGVGERADLTVVGVDQRRRARSYRWGFCQRSHSVRQPVIQPRILCLQFATVVTSQAAVVWNREFHSVRVSRAQSPISRIEKRCDFFFNF